MSKYTPLELKRMAKTFIHAYNYNDPRAQIVLGLLSGITGLAPAICLVKIKLLHRGVMQ